MENTTRELNIRTTAEEEKVNIQSAECIPVLINGAVHPVTRGDTSTRGWKRLKPE